MSEMESASPASEATSTPASTSSIPQASNESASTQGQASSTPASPSPSEPKAYTPNYKFKYPKLDSSDQEEREFDDWAKGFVNEKNEAQLRDLYTKAYGMDFFKHKYSKTNESLKSYKDKYEPLAKTWNELSGLYNQGDMDGFLKGLKIPEEKVFQYVLDKLNERDMPHEQRMERQQQMELRKRAHYLEQQNQELQQRYQSEMVQTRSTQLDSTLNSPEIQSTARSFDERVGRPGAFREEVIKRGALAHYTTGQDISPAQAVQEVLSLIGHSMQGSAPQAGTMNGAKSNTPPPVIPNVGAKSNSPTKRAPRSLDELKKLADQM